MDTIITMLTNQDNCYFCGIKTGTRSYCSKCVPNYCIYCNLLGERRQSYQPKIDNHGNIFMYCKGCDIQYPKIEEVKDPGYD